MKTNCKAVMLVVLALTASCSNEQLEIGMPQEKSIVGGVIEELDSRVVADDELLAGSAMKLIWCPGDEIGVFTNQNENNVKYIINSTENTNDAMFETEQSVSGTPLYAYYPYSVNAGNSYSSIKGSIDKVQEVETYNSVPGLVRYGIEESETNGVVTFNFKNLFSTVRFGLDASGTDLEGERIKSVQIKVVRNYFIPVPIVGDYTFNASTGTYSRSNTSNIVTYEFTNYPELDENNYFVFAASLFPTIKKSSDRIYITVTATGHTASFYVASGVTMAQNKGYNFDLKISKGKTLSIKKNEVEVPDDLDEPEPETPTEPEPEPEPLPVTGTFTCATYNVDGLPDISYIVGSINPDGPGSSGTQSIGQKLASSNWDFIGFSEDFEYHSELSGAMSNYSFGTYRGSVNSSALTSTIDTDGLGFAAKTGVNFMEKAIVAFNESAGGLTSGANTCIKKGFRHYEVTVAQGVVVDVLITHMNTYSSSGSSHINAQHAQLTQIAQYINNLVATNNRPVILMGDTNCRYTRHDFQTYFWSKLNSTLTYSDPWVTYQWDNVYPTYPSKSLMVSDATGTNADTDIICENTQKGEVVDKVIYINNANAPVQIKANSYLRDMNYTGLADHMPIVVEFAYELKQESGQTRSAYDSTFVNGGNAF